MAKNLRFAMFGAGFWARFQLSGWLELEGVECTAIYNRTVSKAEAVAAEFGIPAVYGDPAALLDNEEIDFLDICTAVETHAPFVKMAAERGLTVVCQKPMATTLAEAEDMVEACREAGVKFLVNENWRWHHQIRQFKNILERDTASGKLGKPFRARIAYNSSFPVFENQPFLKNLDQFILTDMGSHLLDVARALFGEAKSLYCRTTRVHPEIKGEDVATVIMEMGDGVTVTVEISYASRGTRDRFPETFITVEAEKGGLELGPDFTIYETTAGGTWYKRFYPPQYPWGDPNYLHLSSIVDCQADLLADLRGERAAETRAEDNIKTVRLVFACYDSAERGELIRF